MARDRDDEHFSGEPVASQDEDIDALTRSLLKDLELGELAPVGGVTDLSAEFASLRELSNDSLKRLGLDVAVTAGLAGDWNLALETVRRLLESQDARFEVKIWQLRCLVECGRHAEALAASQTSPWPREYMLHVNYLTGVAFEALGMKAQANLRFEAVRRQNPHYRDVQFRGSGN